MAANGLSEKHLALDSDTLCNYHVLQHSMTPCITDDEVVYVNVRKLL